MELEGILIAVVTGALVGRAMQTERQVSPWGLVAALALSAVWGAIGGTFTGNAQSIVAARSGASTELDTASWIMLGLWCLVGAGLASWAVIAATSPRRER